MKITVVRFPGTMHLVNKGRVLVGDSSDAQLMIHTGITRIDLMLAKRLHKTAELLALRLEALLSKDEGRDWKFSDEDTCTVCCVSDRFLETGEPAPLVQISLVVELRDTVPGGQRFQLLTQPLRFDVCDDEFVDEIADPLRRWVAYRAMAGFAG